MAEHQSQSLLRSQGESGNHWRCENEKALSQSHSGLPLPNPGGDSGSLTPGRWLRLLGVTFRNKA
jgi:hypothetical protein